MCADFRKLNAITIKDTPNGMDRGESDALPPLPCPRHTGDVDQRGMLISPLFGRGEANGGC